MSPASVTIIKLLLRRTLVLYNYNDQTVLKISSLSLQYKSQHEDIVVDKLVS
jgi:hypothetical protein